MPDPNPLEELTGAWVSRYVFHSTGRNREVEGVHRIELRIRQGRLVGVSDPTPTGTIELDLAIEDRLVTGSWTDRTAPDGYYRGAAYRGVLQLVLDPAGRSMTGMWLGPDKDLTINAGRWSLTRSG